MNERVSESIRGYAVWIYDNHFDRVFLWSFYATNLIENAISDAISSGLCCYEDATFVEVNIS